FEYYRKLIHLRKNHPAFRMTSANKISKSLNFCTKYQIGIVSYCIEPANTEDTWEKFMVIFNSKQETISVPLPEGKYQFIVRGNDINESGLDQFAENNVEVEAISAAILVRV